MSRRWFGWISVFALLLAAAAAQASVPVHGDLTATDACEAFQSYRKGTNPGDVRLEVGKIYPIFELNVRDDALWMRLRVEGASPIERWVSIDCGVATIISGGSSGGSGVTTGGNTGGNTGGSGDPCGTAGHEDSYVLALSWQPAFCETKPDKPECAVTDPAAYQAGNFTLHGLWPNKNDCGTHYGFCGSYKKMVRPFCDYAEVSMQDETRTALGIVMPSAAHGSCLQRHEWHKHGTCQTAWDADAYFKISMRLLAEVTASPLGVFVSQNVGKTVETEAFLGKVDEAFGPGARDRVRLKCKGGNLVDLYIYLPKDMPEGEPLSALIQKGPQSGGNGCGSRFAIDEIDD